VGYIASLGLTTWLAVPETKGVPLEEMQARLGIAPGP